jgi:hypothetical protein
MRMQFLRNERCSSEVRTGETEEPVLLDRPLPRGALAHSFRPFEVTRMRLGDERHQAAEVRLAEGLQVLKVPTGADADFFLGAARVLFELAHPSLRRVRGMGRLDDGRPFVMLDVESAPTLAETGRTW